MGTVETVKMNHVAVMTLSDGKGLNVLRSDIVHDLDTEINEIKKAKDVYCLVLTGAGKKAFVAGANIAEMNGYNEAEMRSYISLGSKLFRKIELLEIPVIAAINGYALGGGCELACACDIRIASDTVTFSQPEVGLGIIPGYGGTQRLARIVGVGIAKELIFSGRNVKSAEALAIGLVNKVVPSDELLSEAVAMAEQIASKGPIAVRLAKKSINAGVIGNIDPALDYEDELLYECFSSQDRKDAMQAFLEKKPFTDFQNC
jgi:enoyl-CoA hydratase